MELIGLKKACSETKTARPYTFYVQINVDVATGEIYTTEHSDVNSETCYHDHNLIHVLTTSSPLTMAQIKEFCQIAIHDHQLLKEYYDDLHCAEARSKMRKRHAYGLLVEALLSMTNCHEKSPEYRDGLEDYLTNMNFHKLVELLEAQNYAGARRLIDDLV